MDIDEAQKNTNIVIRSDALTVGYGSTPIVSGINLTIRAGSVVTLIGRNGSGKSTMLRCFSGQRTPLSGQVFLGGTELFSLSVKERSRRIAILMTERFRSGFLTAREVVEFGRYPYTDLIGRLSEKDHEAVESAMEELRITGLADRLFSELSDGQRQLVMLARAICQEPELLIMDEPTTFLDINYKLELLKIVRGLSERGIAVLMSLHELELAREISDEAVCIKGGQVVRVGDVKETLTRDFIAELFDIKDMEMLGKLL